jgi:hypothetical protein
LETFIPGATTPSSQPSAVIVFRLQICDSEYAATSPDYPLGIRGKEVLAKHATPIESNSNTKGKESGTTLKAKPSERLELQGRRIQPHAEDSSAHHAPSHEEIRRRAYEIYLEHGSLPGSELDDWLQAERELQKVALFTEDWNRLQRRRGPDSGGGN